MATYKRNFYGGSSYGYLNTHHGHYKSDKIKLYDPIKSGGSLISDLITNMPTVSYDINTPVILDEGSWVNGQVINNHQTVETSVKGDILQIDITCRNPVLTFIQRMDGAIASVTIEKYENGSVTTTNTLTIDTINNSTLNLNEPDFANYKITISIDALSTDGNLLEFESVEGIICHLLMEFKNYSSETWSGWQVLNPTITPIELNDYQYSFNSGDITGAMGYQFRLILLTFEAGYSPEIKEVDIHTANLDEYAEDGFWKMLIDLGSDFDLVNDTIDNLTFSTVENNGEVTIVTRTTNDTNAETEMDENISYSYYSPPYTDALNRFTINMPSKDISSLANSFETTGQFIEEYFTTPLYKPDFITNWFEINPDLSILGLDPIDEMPFNNIETSSEEADRSFIKIQFLDKDYEVIDTIGENDTLRLRGYEDLGLIKKALNRISEPIRVKIIFSSQPKYPSAALDAFSIISTCYYQEIRRFSDGTYNPNEYRQENWWEISNDNVLNGIEGYGSKVFGDNTGVSKVFTNGKTRSMPAIVSDFGFNIPPELTPTEVSYEIEKIKNYENNQEMSDNLNIYWKASNSKVTSDISNQLMVEVKNSNSLINLHKSYGSGITLKIQNELKSNYDQFNRANLFYPSLSVDKLNNQEYSFYLMNGFEDEAINPNVDIRWNSENILDVTAVEVEDRWNYRRGVTLNNSDKINASITSTKIGGLSKWISKENIFEIIINEGSPILNKDEVFDNYEFSKIYSNNLPNIPEDIITLTENPYRVELISTSIQKEGKSDYNAKINLELNSHSISQTPIRNEVVEKAKIIKSNSSEDYLFTPRIMSMVGVYSDKNLGAPDYLEGTHYQLINNKIDWSLGYDDPGVLESEMPTAGDSLFVDYEYLPMESITIKAMSPYKEKIYEALNIYSTNLKRFIGECRKGIDYISEEIDIEKLWPEVSKNINSMQLKVVNLNNPNVRVYTRENKVIGTLSSTRNNNSWKPTITEGNYSIGKDDYYMYNFYNNYVIGDNQIINMDNLVKDGDFSIIEKSTENLFIDGDFENSSTIKNILIDDFQR